MSNTDSSTRARSDKERALSRASDALAGYMSDERGWASPTTGPEVFHAATQGDIGDIESAIGDLIADLLHLTEHLHLTATLGEPAAALAAVDAIHQRAYNHHGGEREGDLDEAWNTITDPAYMPGGNEPVIVVFRHPDYNTETTEHYLDVRVIDIDLGSSFDITSGSRDDEDTIAEYADHLRAEVADLPADHSARVEVESIIEQHLADDAEVQS